MLKEIEPLLPPFIRSRTRHFVISVFRGIGIVFDLEKKFYYGQIGEDAFLRHYLREKDGFFVDIGAYAPRRYSNTYYFYKLGWRGINIDATPGSMKEFRIIRKRDINLEVGVSCTEGMQYFYTWPSVGGQNTFSEETAKRFSGDLNAVPTVINVVTRRLDNILDEYLPDGQKINLMSVDVEGREMDVLQSNDWEKYRPKWLVVEKLQTNLNQMLHTEVTSLLSEKGYELFAYMPPDAYFVERG